MKKVAFVVLLLIAASVLADKKGSISVSESGNLENPMYRNGRFDYVILCDETTGQRFLYVCEGSYKGNCNTSGMTAMDGKCQQK